MMRKVISLLLAAITTAFLLCSCNGTEVKEPTTQTEPTIAQTEEVDEVALGLEKHMSEYTHDKGEYAIFAVEGALSRKNGDRIWLVCYIDNDGDTNWYMVEWRYGGYEVFPFQP